MKSMRLVALVGSRNLNVGYRVALYFKLGYSPFRETERVSLKGVNQNPLCFLSIVGEKTPTFL